MRALWLLLWPALATAQQNAEVLAERMAEAFHIQLMERNGDNPEWRAYLVESFRANKPWDQLAREILGPDFKDAKLRGAGYFITRRLDKVGQQDTDYPGTTRDAGRLFMGVDLQCCQCHKHLTVKDYKQVDFNGLFVAIQNTRLQAAGGDYKVAWLQEGLMTNKYEFVSVLSSVKGATGPRVPLGVEVPLPDPAKDELWAVPPDKKARTSGVPKFSPLKELAARVASPENPLFARNIANRVWWQLMGRGLVEPLDKTALNVDKIHPKMWKGNDALQGVALSTVMVYRKDKYPKGGPRNWADFWDVKKFPGARSMRNHPADNLEFALLADGVPKDKGGARQMAARIWPDDRLAAPPRRRGRGRAILHQ